MTNDNFAAADRARTALRRIQTRMVVEIADAAAGHRTRSVAAFQAARRSETVVFGETLFTAVLGLLLVLAGMPNRPLQDNAWTRPRRSSWNGCAVRR